MALNKLEIPVGDRQLAGVRMRKPKSSPKKSKMSTFDAMMAWEGGNLTMKQYFTLFADLVKSGQAWSLQGMYGRTASRMIADGYISQHGKILWKEIKAQGIDLDAMLYQE